MMKPLLQHLLRAAANLPFFVVAFLLFALHVLLQCSVLFKPPLQVYNFTLRRFKVFLLHFAAITAAVCCLLFSLCLLLRFVLNCDAKVQTYLQTCKHFPEKVCIFNLLQQIKLFLPKFIHILSTNLAKCAIYKANIFVCGCNTYVPYIITNNNAIFVQLLQCVCIVLLCGILVGYIPAKTPPLQRYNVAPDFHHLRKGMIYLFPCSCAVVGVLRWINTYYLCAVCRVRAWYVWILFKCGYILYMLLVFIQSFMFRYVILDLVYYFNRTLYRQCFCVYGRFFAREYLYIA